MKEKINKISYSPIQYLTNAQTNASVQEAFSRRKCVTQRGGGGEATPLHMGYKGMCSPKGYGSSAVLVINSYRFKPVCRHFGNK